MKGKREMVEQLKEQGLSERAACRAMELARCSCRYRESRSAQRKQRGQFIRAEVLRLAKQHRRYGYRRITALLRRQGESVNPKRIRRICREEGLSLPRRRPRRRRGTNPGNVPNQATHRGHVWTYDFVFDRTQDSRVLKMLAILDEWTRECHRIHVGRRLDSQAVVQVLLELFGRHGAPEYLRSDNGPEFIAAQVRQWLGAQGTGTIYIEPGHPWENGYAESFNGKFRDECLNEEIFASEREAQVIVELWRRQYNESRPHSALGYRTPAEMAKCPAGPAPTVNPINAGHTSKGAPD